MFLQIGFKKHQNSGLKAQTEENCHCTTPVALFAVSAYASINSRPLASSAFCAVPIFSVSKVPWSCRAVSAILSHPAPARHRRAVPAAPDGSRSPAVACLRSRPGRCRGQLKVGPRRARGGTHRPQPARTGTPRGPGRVWRRAGPALSR